MRENSISKAVGEQVRRTLWEVRNVKRVIDVLPQRHAPVGLLPQRVRNTGVHVADLPQRAAHLFPDRFGY